MRGNTDKMPKAVMSELRKSINRRSTNRPDSSGASKDLSAGQSISIEPEDREGKVNDRNCVKPSKTNLDEKSVKTSQHPISCFSSRLNLV